MSTSTDRTDRTEKRIVLHAPQARVWQALTDSAEFGRWFGVNLDGPFVAGQRVRGQITSKGYEHLKMEVAVERVEPQSHFAFQWHPYAIDPNVDYASEAMTRVTFARAPVPEGTQLTIVESGFDEVPAARRALAFEMNDAGWAAQLRAVEKHLLNAL